jgi:hypothetical protein
MYMNYACALKNRGIHVRLPIYPESREGGTVQKAEAKSVPEPHRETESEERGR